MRARLPCRRDAGACKAAAPADAAWRDRAAVCFRAPSQTDTFL